MVKVQVVEFSKYSLEYPIVVWHNRQILRILFGVNYSKLRNVSEISSWPRSRKWEEEASLSFAETEITKVFVGFLFHTQIHWSSLFARFFYLYLKWHVPRDKVTHWDEVHRPTGNKLPKHSVYRHWGTTRVRMMSIAKSWKAVIGALVLLIQVLE